MSELTWHEKLNHIRFMRLLLWTDHWLTWMTLIVILWLRFPPLFIAVYVVLRLISVVISHSKTRELEDAAGLPTNHLVIRF
jgi:hypothetical protein